ncbi:MAG: bifunctional phosphopantothenoylcysteine decarboxylase/phosphopantothenate--cysteine ligase CoaBC, partial [Aquificae bacterium]|nr:bifunctional phosphopantothenoylcysteine decarboxylase/phosphopantothenate--cysteine ligase CoaBC [Aquificota bacterium]
LKKRGYAVTVVTSPAAEKFVTKLTFKTLADEAYAEDDWQERPLLHVELARAADAFLIAPLTANTLAKLAHGLADNLLTATALAHHKPLLLAPAMNATMLAAPPTQENLKKLTSYGHEIVKPEEGLLACNEYGEGKLASTERLLLAVERALHPKPLKGKKVLVTGGATREYLDPVRYLSNDSSGRMASALARAAYLLGASVELILGHASVPPPEGLPITRVTTAEQMRRALLERFPEADLVIMNAAVADFRPAETYRNKLKKSDELTVKLVKNPDLLEELGKLKTRQKLVGFALETERLLENAYEKLKKKNLDAVVANPASVMGSERFEGYLITRNERLFLKGPKEQVALELLEKLSELL